MLKPSIRNPVQAPIAAEPSHRISQGGHGVQGHAFAHPTSYKLQAFSLSAAPPIVTVNSQYSELVRLRKELPRRHVVDGHVVESCAAASSVWSARRETAGAKRHLVMKITA